MYATNHLPVIDMSRSTTGCCARFDPSKWDNEVFTFEEKPFVRAETSSLLYIPLNMSSVMTTAQAEINEAGAMTNESIMLSRDLSPWKAEHYIAIARDVPSLDTTKLSGKFMTKVFEGPYKNMRKWHNELAEYIKTKGMTPLKTYFYYTTCPKCSKAYGENYVVGFQQVEEQK